MNKNLISFGVVLVLALISTVAPLWAQSGAGAEIWAARDQVISQLVQELPAGLPEGALAILPPEVVSAEYVDRGAATTWTTAVVESLHSLRPSLKVVDRASLTTILREQKFGDSAYADPQTAVKVGKLAAARLLLMTRLHEFRLKRGRVRVRLEARLIDVETGEDLWSKALSRGVFPWWARIIIGIVLLLIAVVLWRWWLKHTKKKLVREKLPRVKSEARVDVDALARSATRAREKLMNAGEKDAAAVLQKAWTEMDAALERVRHALPGGTIDRSRVRDLKGAVSVSGRLAAILQSLQQDCDGMNATESEGQALSRRMSDALTEVQAAVSEYRRLMV